MSLVRPIRKSIRSLVSCRATIMFVAALSVLWARNTPPRLPHSPLNLAVHLLADQDHRQCFDQEDSQWATPPSTLPPIPLPLVFFGSIHNAAALIEFVNDGLPYNRPPPVSSFSFLA